MRERDAGVNRPSVPQERRDPRHHEGLERGGHLLGLVGVAAHGILGAAGIMTAAQWQSGAMIGGLLITGAGGALATR